MQCVPNTLGTWFVSGILVIAALAVLIFFCGLLYLLFRGIWKDAHTLWR